MSPVRFFTCYKPMPHVHSPQKLTAFANFNQIAAGEHPAVLAQLRAMTFPQDTSIRVFDDVTGECLDFDLRTNARVESTMSVAAPPEAGVRSVGRPRLGIVAREVTLLPRHWEWLNQQPGGASVALRRLVDDSRKANGGRDTVRAAREAAYRFMSNMTSALPGFEDASRALFVGDQALFAARVAPWPADVRAQLGKLAAAGWSQP